MLQYMQQHLELGGRMERERDGRIEEKLCGRFDEGLNEVT